MAQRGRQCSWSAEEFMGQLGASKQNFDRPATAYAAFDRHTFGDMAPYVYRTTDFGKTWTPLITRKSSRRSWVCARN